jgi:hypothetical protein
MPIFYFYFYLRILWTAAQGIVFINIIIIRKYKIVTKIPYSCHRRAFYCYYVGTLCAVRVYPINILLGVQVKTRNTWVNINWVSYWEFNYSGREGIYLGKIISKGSCEITVARRTLMIVLRHLYKCPLMTQSKTFQTCFSLSINNSPKESKKTWLNRLLQCAIQK